MSGASWTSGQPRERHASPAARHASGTSTSSSTTEVRFNDPFVRLDHARRPLGDLLAVVEHEHRLAESHHDLHVVLDQQDGLATVAKPAHRLEQVVEQRAVHAGGGLVEQDQRGIAHEDADELHQLLLAVRQVAGVFVREALELDEAEQLSRPGLGVGQAPTRHHQEILERRQLGEHADDLEGPADPAARDLVRLEPVDPLAVEAHASGVAPLDAGDAVEERGLARPVGPDEAVDTPRLERQRHAIDRGDAAEALAQPLHLENGSRHQIVRGRRYRCCSRPRIPRGISNTTATMIEPNSSWWRYGKRAQTTSCETNITTAPST